LDNEIANLRKIINEYKNKEIQENEPMLKLEIVNLINTVNAKSSENELLQNENKNLKNHVNMLQENINKYFSDNIKNSLNSIVIKEPKKVEREQNYDNYNEEKENMNKDNKEQKQGKN
jgi:hypothetical protein